MHFSRISDKALWLQQKEVITDNVMKNKQTIWCQPVLHNVVIGVDFEPGHTPLLQR